jgi:hypothetical protein
MLWKQFKSMAQLEEVGWLQKELLDVIHGADVVMTQFLKY